MKPEPRDADRAARTTADLLGDYVRAAQAYPVGRIERAFTDVRGRYEAVLSETPHNSAAASGLTVLTMAKLLSYVFHGPGHRSSNTREWPLGRSGPLEELSTPLPADDATGHELANDVVHAARCALTVDPSDNLAAFFLGHALCHLGDEAEARAAWQEALRLDPADHVVAELLPALDECPATPPPEPPYVCRCPRGFLLVRHRFLISNNGDRAEVSWLLNDPVDVRKIVDAWVDEHPWADSFEDDPEASEDYWDLESPYFDPLPGEDLSLEVHSHAEPVTVQYLDRGLRRSPDDTVHIDWSAIQLPSGLRAPLSTGQPVRCSGRWYLFGENYHHL
ncbi:tetratricopeptide repeat protein [Spirillospora sp. NPDC052269]